MKDDLRLTYPLWQMAGIGIAICFVLLIGYAGSFNMFADGGLEVELSFNTLTGAAAIATLLVFVLYVVLFLRRVARHNREFPDHPISHVKFRPQEYMEDDELFEVFTQRATKKVYAYFNILLPALIAVFCLVPIPKTWIIVIICLASMGQYFIYYRTMRSYVAAE
ncbi:hypothetical protein [Sporosarcina koreensis]|uniref:hypothetical protein n=1 Tax=Sporosarcina koreensis TaxID=334735 RepID=UPI00058D629E|nr:hypothetical protein [Sporosarcina koreensis]